jgi:hypothetical protein
MKLADHIVAIDLAFEALISSMDDLKHASQVPRQNYGRRIHGDLSQTRGRDIVPQLPDTFQPLTYHTTLYNKEKLLQLAAFEATYQDAKTPISPDMVPLIIDTGASITVTPYKTDFISDIRPVQSVEIKGIASGLQVRGFGDVSYSFQNDNMETQTMILKDCLYVPQCPARLLCPRQIGTVMGNLMDGINAVTEKSILTVDGKPTTFHYDKLSQLPILYTTSGISSYHRFCAHQSYIQQKSFDSQPNFLYQNLSPKQPNRILSVLHANLAKHTSAPSRPTRAISLNTILHLAMVLAQTVWKRVVQDES